ncbi:MFS transporter [Mycolicibacterium insubricum]|jgi:EmrB/QacA subfamily drug resistance transporter|uniref:MFS transporter n=1 Tax=Mycolicibacterium insubricum TaxID=444597 RepID=A0A1X0DC16_9MYCO|nr:MFS transporter [Mycolicibacterium insubricum]MCV7080820.1 MFS transporter [Mycolicibacterium insubricum]ORA69921.1 MFS transporter [Mycolicibacterium insubricum]BBZ65912.1 MFS transporter [Mycolicibacterium insubricum]
MTASATQVAETESPAEPPMHRRVWTLVAACFGLLLVLSSMVALNTALGDLAIETSATQTQLTWIVDAYTLVMACLLLPAGALGDRFGRRGALLFGLVVFAIASAAPILAPNPAMLIISRGLAGAGAAFIMPATLSLITSVYSREERTKAVGLWAGVSGIGGVVGMLGSGVLLNFWSWPSIFWAFTISSVALIPLTLLARPSKESEPHPLDTVGAVLIGAAVAIFVFGILEIPSRGFGDPVVYGCLGAGVVLAIGFAAVELRRRHPLLDVRLFSNTTFATGAAAITMVFFALYGFFFIYMQFIQIALGYSALGTAVALTPLAPPLLFLAATSFWYLPRMGLRLVVFLGLAITGAGFICMRYLTLDSDYWGLAWPILILTTGLGLTIAPTTTAIMSSIPDDKQGVGSAVNDTTREVGAALGIALAGSMLATQYTRVLAPSLDGFPQPVREAATRSLGEAIGVSGHLGPAGQGLVDAAMQAFTDATHFALTILGAVTVISAVLIGLWAPGRDGRQLALVRRLTGGGYTGRHRAH